MSHEYKRLKNGPPSAIAALNVHHDDTVAVSNHLQSASTQRHLFRIKYESQSLDDAMCRIGCPTLRHSNIDDHDQVHRDVRRSVVDRTRQTRVGPSLSLSSQFTNVWETSSESSIRMSRIFNTTTIHGASIVTFHHNRFGSK